MKKMSRSKAENNSSGQVTPQRTCLTCRSVRDKKDLVRLVNTPAGTVEIDITGKKPGRGAYLCRVAACMEQGIKKARLEKALRASFEPGNIKQLEENLKTMAEKTPAPIDRE